MLSRWKEAMIVALIGGLGYTVTMVKIPNVDGVKIIDTATLQVIDDNIEMKAKELPLNESPVCPKVEPTIVLSSEIDLLKGKKWFVADLGNYEVTKVNKRDDDITVYYRQFGKKKIYLTIEEDNNDITYNTDYK